MLQARRTTNRRRTGVPDTSPAAAASLGLASTVLAAALAWAVMAAPVGFAQERSVWDGVYTDVQADRAE